MEQQSPQVHSLDLNHNKNFHFDSSASDVEQPSEPKIEQPSSKRPTGPPPPPNGGLIAWLQVVGGFMLFFNTWGILNAFGVFQTYYESGALFDRSSSDISWIGSIQASMLLVVGFFTGSIYDRGYLRLLLIIGSFCIVFGHMMLSLCKTYGEVLLAQGFCVGIGAGCLFVPSKLGMALGLAVSGSSLGGVIYPIVLNQLIGPLGFAWSVRVIGFIAFGTLLVPIAVMKQRVKPPRARALIDWSAFLDLPYMTFVFASLVAFMGLFVLLFYISYFGAAKPVTDTRMAFYMVPILNAASCFGRTIPNAMADKMGPFNLITPCCIMIGVLMLCLVAVTTEGGLIVIALLSGFFSGALIGLPPLCFVALTKDKTRIGTRVGMGFGMIGLGVLAGGPAGGAILSLSDHTGWTGLWVFGGVTALAAGFMYLGLRIVLYGCKLRVKA
ncbi:monocarboxylate transporter, putative [Talaromyces stipitatus ATCC 10500]|uniref:Monocarboxylate transporter, putative n=1 Tax=Talaromyces stipitatus (strain ATCC 10500 / CBS 375.48 / QM 6759 / NRRL 1006) TaxID=441959 RepID=B8MT39_TALSN|nr:monocarboxylate transporter, putative [Talaromyces stipitatus ATCC 10500]EED12119.1 monocarboxylate transporter, putative [Talaromyces stipitatus ATCC 10500]